LTRSRDYFAVEAAPLAASAAAFAAASADVEAAAAASVAEPEAAAAAPEAAAAALDAASAAGAAAGAGAGAATGAGAGAGAGSSFLPQAASATEATNVARTSDFFISGFLLIGEERRTTSGNCQRPPAAAFTEKQGLELLLLSPRLYGGNSLAQVTTKRLKPPDLPLAPQSPSVTAGNDGELLPSHPSMLSRRATRRSASLPQ